MLHIVTNCMKTLFLHNFLTFVILLHTECPLSRLRNCFHSFFELLGWSYTFGFLKRLSKIIVFARILSPASPEVCLFGSLMQFHSCTLRLCPAIKLLDFVAFRNCWCDHGPIHSCCAGLFVGQEVLVQFIRQQHSAVCCRQPADKRKWCPVYSPSRPK